jgi:plasmid rolling circle replication initiator protein Rep
MKELLKQYHNVVECIQDHFECGGLYQIDDATKEYWRIDGNTVLFGNNPSDEEFMYSSEIFANAADNTYRKRDHTLVHTHENGYYYSMIFDNTKEIF